MESEDEPSALTVVALASLAAVLCVLLLAGGVVTPLALAGLVVVGFLMGFRFL